MRPGERTERPSVAAAALERVPGVYREDGGAASSSSSHRLPCLPRGPGAGLSEKVQPRGVGAALHPSPPPSPCTPPSSHAHTQHHLSACASGTRRPQAGHAGPKRDLQAPSARSLPSAGPLRPLGVHCALCPRCGGPLFGMPAGRPFGLRALAIWQSERHAWVLPLPHRHERWALNPAAPPSTGGLPGWRSSHSGLVPLQMFFSDWLTVGSLKLI